MKKLFLLVLLSFIFISCNSSKVEINRSTRPESELSVFIALDSTNSGEAVLSTLTNSRLLNKELKKKHYKVVENKDEANSILYGTVDRSTFNTYVYLELVTLKDETIFLATGVCNTSGGFSNNPQGDYNTSFRRAAEKIPDFYKLK